MPEAVDPIDPGPHGMRTVALSSYGVSEPVE
jgi:hypothetical protein